MLTKVVVPIVVAVIAAVGGLLYEDMKAFILPDEFPAHWVLVGNEIGEQPGVHRLFEEGLELRGRGEALKGKGELGDFKREYAGYRKGGNFALSYRTPKGLGVGVVLAGDVDGRERQYLGYWTGKDCTMKKIVECPALIVRGKPGSQDVAAAKDRHASFLNAPCREIAASTCP